MLRYLLKKRNKDRDPNYVISFIDDLDDARAFSMKNYVLFGIIFTVFYFFVLYFSKDNEIAWWISFCIMTILAFFLRNSISPQIRLNINQVIIRHRRRLSSIEKFVSQKSKVSRKNLIVKICLLIFVLVQIRFFGNEDNVNTQQIYKKIVAVLATLYAYEFFKFKQLKYINALSAITNYKIDLLRRIARR